MPGRSSTSIRGPRRGAPLSGHDREASAPSIEVSSASPGRRWAGRATRRRGARASNAPRGHARATWAGPDRGSPTPGRPSPRPQEGANRRTGEEQEGDHRRHRIPRQASDQRAARRHARTRSASPASGPRPEDPLDAELLESALDVVVVPHRDTARDHGDVSIEGGLDRGPGRDRIVADRLDAGDLGAGAERERRDRVGVRVSDPARPGRIPRLQQLVAGRQDSRAGTAGAADLDRRPTEARTPSSAAPIVTPLRRTGARLDVVPRRRTLLPGSTSTDTSTRPSRVAVSSTRTTESAPSGSIAPVEIAIACPASSDDSGRPARPRLVGDPQGDRGAALAPRGIRGPHGESVHRGVVEGGTGSALSTSTASTLPAPSAAAPARPPAASPARAPGGVLPSSIGFSGTAKVSLQSTLDHPRPAPGRPPVSRWYAGYRLWLLHMQCLVADD